MIIFTNILGGVVVEPHSINRFNPVAYFQGTRFLCKGHTILVIFLLNSNSPGEQDILGLRTQIDCKQWGATRVPPTSKIGLTYNQAKGICKD